MNKRTCKVKDCTSPVCGLGWCSKHYQRWKRNGDPLTITRRAPVARIAGTTCAVDDCGKPVQALGWCGMHYRRWRLHGSLELPVRIKKTRKTCSVGKCGQPVEALGWCNKHYLRWRQHGDPRFCAVSAITITCSEPECKRRDAKYGLCWMHYRETVARLGEVQGWKCAICKVHKDDAPRKTLLLDHNHATGKIRKLLCHRCNVGLGLFMDNPVLLLAAAGYLRAA